MNSIWAKAFVSNAPTEDLEKKIRIQIGRSVIFNDKLSNFPGDKLARNQLELLESLLSLQISEKAVDSNCGTINIDLGREKIFRYAQGKVEVNFFAQSRISEQPFTTEEIGSDEIIFLQEERFEKPEDLETIAAEEVTEVDALVYPIEADVYSQNLLTEVEEVGDRTGLESRTANEELNNGLLVALSQNRGIQDFITAELAEIDFESIIAPGESIQNPDMQPSGNASIVKVDVPVVNNKRRFGWVESLAQKARDSAKEKLPAMAIALIAFHESNLKEPTKAFVSEMYAKHSPELKRLAKEASYRGISFAKEGLKASAKQLATLSEKAKHATIAHGIVQITQALNNINPREPGQEGYPYLHTCEGFIISENNANDFTLNNHNGQEIFRFQSSKEGFSVSNDRLNGLQFLDIVKVMMQLRPQELSPSTNAMTLDKVLGSFAPKGTQEASRVEENQIIGKLCEFIINADPTYAVASEVVGNSIENLSSALAVSTPVGIDQNRPRSRDIEGYQLNCVDGKISILANDGRGEIFNQSADSIQSRLNSFDIRNLKQAAQAPVKEPEKQTAAVGGR